MSSIDFGTSVSLNEFANLIATVGTKVTIIGQGEPGIGKSAMLEHLARSMPEYDTAYIDCTLLDLGDLALPFTQEMGGMRVVQFAPNARFKFHVDRPVIVMLDEIGKAGKSIKNALLTLMLEQRLGDAYLPEGSIVFGTTNMMSDGVGDSLEAHVRNRVCFVTVRKPHAGFNSDGTVDSDSWGSWAIDNGIAPEIIAWVKQFPQCLSSYKESGQRENPYIYNPTQAGQVAFVTPRSLEKASDIAKQRALLGDAVTISALSGTIGQAAARDMQAFFTVVDKLPAWEVVINDPEHAMVPEDTVAKCILVFSALTRIRDDGDLNAWLVYMRRIDKELQALFARSMARSTTKQTLATSNKKFIRWAVDNEWLF